MYSSKSFLKVVCIASLVHFYGYSFAQPYKLVKESPDDYHSIIFGFNRKYIASGSIEFKAGYTFEGKTNKSMDAYIDNSNDFRIGMFTAFFDKTKSSICKDLKGNPMEVIYDTPFDANGSFTSTLNVLAGDGFNVYNSYFPNNFQSQIELENILKLTKKLNIKVEPDIRSYYRANISNNRLTGTGESIFDNCGINCLPCEQPWQKDSYRPNCDNLFNSVFTKLEYKDVIWGYHVSEEASNNHQTFRPIDCKVSSKMADKFARHTDGSGWVYVENDERWVLSEIPPANVLAALNHYKSLSTNTNQKVVIMEVNHGGTINDFTNDSDYADVNGTPYYFQNQPIDHNPQEYVKLLNKSDDRSVFFEGSYGVHDSGKPFNYLNILTSNGGHYLGKFKSISYALKYASQVHSVFFLPVRDGYNPNTNYPRHLDYWHSNASNRNANWLWFETYTSIIHGATGIWFWEFGGMYDPSNNQNIENYLKINHFRKDAFPANYNEYVAPLANELRYLVNNNYISTNPASILATKTDTPDSQGIIEKATKYIDNLIPEERSENYGLRYTIRTNGTEVIMIVTNPLHRAVSTEFNFSNSSIAQIKNADGFDILFEDISAFNNTSSSNYKLNRKNKVNLTENTLNSKVTWSFNTNKKKVKLFFGPLDTHVLKFFYKQ